MVEDFSDDLISNRLVLDLILKQPNVSRECVWLRENRRLYKLVMIFLYICDQAAEAQRKLGIKKRIQN